MTGIEPPRSRGRRGEGTQRERRPGVWKIRIPTAPGLATGRARQISITVHGTAEDAHAKRRLLVAQHAAMPTLPPSSRMRHEGAPLGPALGYLARVQDHWLQRFLEMAEGLAGRASQGKEAEVGAPFDPRVQDSIELIGYGEPAVALENLAQNIYEYDVHVSRGEYAIFREAGTAMALDPSSWTFLEILVG